MGGPAHQPYESQTSLGGDSRYYGQGGGGRPQDSTADFRDDIPLRDHPHQVPPKDNYNNDNDHVYDAPLRPSNLEAGRHGMGNNMRLPPPKNSKWKLAWVCYIFGAVQIAVFIGELVKNGEY
jgi:hypothetical protein